MSSPEVNELRFRHAADVTANRLRLAEGWDQPCLAYNVIISPDAAAARSACALQQFVLRAEPALLAVPPRALHVSAAWLIPVHEHYPVPKDEIWRLHGPSWQAAMARQAARLTPFRLALSDVVATDAAVVAVGPAPAQIRLIRRSVARLPGIGSVSAGDMIHLTLFRYAEPLADPARLLRELSGLRLDLRVRVTELQLVREIVFPSLAVEILRRFALSAERTTSSPPNPALSAQ